VFIAAVQFHHEDVCAGRTSTIIVHGVAVVSS